MLQTASRLLPELPLFLMTAVATHLVMSFAQTLTHYKLGHQGEASSFGTALTSITPNYSKDHLLLLAYLGDEGNNTPFFFIPVFLVGACTYLLLPVDLFMVQVVACAASLCARLFRQGIPRRGDRGFSDLHGLDGNRNCTSFITGTQTAISR
jgi:hypothetical protein